MSNLCNVIYSYMYLYNTATDPNAVIMRVAVIVLAVTTSLLVIALLVMCLLLVKIRLKRRKETYQIPYYSQPTIPPLPQRNRRNNSTSSDNATSNDVIEGLQNHSEFTEISQDSNEEIRIPANTNGTGMLHDVLSADQQNEDPNITLDQNLAYEANVAIAPEIATEENVAYSTSKNRNQDYVTVL